MLVAAIDNTKRVDSIPAKTGTFQVSRASQRRSHHLATKQTRPNRSTCIASSSLRAPNKTDRARPASREQPHLPSSDTWRLSDADMQKTPQTDSMGSVAVELPH